MQTPRDDEAQQERSTTSYPKVCCAGAVLVVLAIAVAVFAFAMRVHDPRVHNPRDEAVPVPVHGGPRAPFLPGLRARVITDKPRGDTRNYQHAILANGLEVMNVQDPMSLKSSFAMAVKAGSFDDPEKLPGLAHFCEHMLFLGTKKYPEPSGFDNFMSRNAGQNNAYTAPEVTVYFGAVSHAADREGLDRFADFFRAPLFDRRFVQKEVHAIDSEHAKNVQDPARRITETLNSLADPQNPMSRFHTGSVETLWDTPRKNGTDPVDDLKVYFRNRYCPSQMKLVTFGSDSLRDQLTVAQREFGGLKPGGKWCRVANRSFAIPAAFPPSRLAKWVVIKGTQPQPQLWLHFALPDLRKEYTSQPLEYLDYVLGYQGADSLTRVLQDTLGFANSVSTMYDMSSAGTSLYIVVTLTESGHQSPEAVMDVIFAYLAAIRHAGVDMSLYQTIADVMKLKWDWQEPVGPMNAASKLAELMTRLPVDRLLTGDARIDRLDAAIVSSLLERLTPDAMNAAFVDPGASRETTFQGQQVRTLPYYGVEFAVQEIDAVLPGAAARWRGWLQGEAGRPELGAALRERLRAASLLGSAGAAATTATVLLPVAPSAIDNVPKEILLDNMRAADGGAADGVAALFGPRPTRLGLEVAAPAPAEARLLQDARHGGPLGDKDPQVWYRSGWVTTSPKVTIQMVLRPQRMPGESDISAFDAVRLGIYSRLLAEEISPKMADLTATGVAYSIDVSSAGLAFSFGGFAPVMPRLVDTVLAEFNNFNENLTMTAASRFGRIVQELREELTMYTAMPVEYAVQDRNLLLLRGPHSRNESLAVLESITLTSAVKSVGELLLSRPLQLTALAMGNLREREGRAAVDKLRRGIRTPAWLNASSTNAGKVDHVTQVVNPARPVEVRARNPRDGDTNDAVVMTLVFGVSTVASRVTLGLLGQIFGTVVYGELRTSRQLGYVVNAGAGLASNVQYVSAVVQGNVLRADEAEAAIELVFTKLMPQRLSNLTESEFNSYVDAFRQELLQPPMAPSEELAHFWAPIKQGGQCFELQREVLRYLNSSQLTHQSLMDAWARLATPKDGMRKKVVIKYFSGDVPPRPTAAQANATLLGAGVPESVVPMILRERERSMVLDRVDSAMRQRVADEGGYFAQDLRCSVDGGQPAGSLLTTFLQRGSRTPRPTRRAGRRGRAVRGGGGSALRPGTGGRGSALRGGGEAALRP